MCTSSMVQMLGLIDITTSLLVVVERCTTRRIQDRFRSVWNSSVGAVKESNYIYSTITNR